MLGVHGRRRSGPGETFWQFRPYMPGEPARQIDWRRSARDRHLYVREREWEASQTVWLWADLSSSMDFQSRLSNVAKIDRALVLLLALADMLARGGERVGMPGVAPARIGRDAADRFAAALAREERRTDWPEMEAVARFSHVVVLGDLLSEPSELHDRIRAVTGRGAVLHLLQIFDPAEEVFPYEGRLEFRDPETGQIWLSERAGGVREAYRRRLSEHRAEIAALAQKTGSSFGVHHTDRPAAEALLFLRGRLSGAVPGSPAGAELERRLA